MLGDFGLSFAPTAQNAADQKTTQGQTPIADAIKVLSLRIPQFVGARGGGLSPLMGAAGDSPFVPGAGSVPGGLEELLRRVFGQMGTATGATPAPNVVPGGGVERLPVPQTGVGEGIFPGGPQRPPVQPGGEVPRRPPMLGGRTPYQQMP